MRFTAPDQLPDIVTSNVLSAVKSRDNSIMVFGSVARGDQSVTSDIDVFELSAKRRRPYKVGRVNVSVYDEPTLVSNGRARKSVRVALAP